MMFQFHPNRLLAIAIVSLACSMSPGLVGAQDESQKAESGKGAPKEHPVEYVLDPQGFRESVRGIAFSHDDKWLAAADARNVRIWDVESGQLLHSLWGDRNAQGSGDLWSVAFNPIAGELLVGTDDQLESLESSGVIRVYDTANMSEIKGIVKTSTSEFGGEVGFMAFSSDGQTLAMAEGTGEEIVFWDWPARKVSKRLKLPAGKDIVTDLTFLSPEPILCAEIDGTREYYSLPEGRWLRVDKDLPPVAAKLEQLLKKGALGYPPGWDEVPPNWHLAFDQKKFLTTGRSVVNGVGSYWVLVWDTDTFKTISSYYGHPWTVMSMALSHSGELVASSDELGEVHLWDVRTGKRKHRLRAAGLQIYDAALSADTSKLYLATKHYQGTEFRRNHYGAINALFDFKTRMLSPVADPRQVDVSPAPIALGNLSVRVIRENDAARTVAYREGRELVRFKDFIEPPTSFSLLPRHGLGIPYAVAFGNDVGSVEIWNAETGKELISCDGGHEGFVTSVRGSPNGTLLVSASTDRTIRMWELGDYTSSDHVDLRPPALSMFITADGEWVLWTSNGYYDASPGAERFVGAQTSFGTIKPARFDKLGKDRHRPDVINRILETGSLAKATGEQQQK